MGKVKRATVYMEYIYTHFYDQEGVDDWKQHVKTRKQPYIFHKHIVRSLTYYNMNVSFEQVAKAEALLLNIKGVSHDSIMNSTSYTAMYGKLHPSYQSIKQIADFFPFVGKNKDIMCLNCKSNEFKAVITVSYNTTTKSHAIDVNEDFLECNNCGSKLFPVTINRLYYDY